MTLTTHTIAGAAIGSLLPGYPIVAFGAAVASHFALDAIPHWDYPLYSASINPEKGGSLKLDRAVMRDLFDIGLDFAIGIAVSLYFFHAQGSLISVGVGLIGGVLPDFWQFVYTRFPYGLNAHIQNFHKWIHSPRKLRQEGKSMIGIASQLAIIAAVIFAAKFF